MKVTIVTLPVRSYRLSHWYSYRNVFHYARMTVTYLTSSIRSYFRSHQHSVLKQSSLLPDQKPNMRAPSRASISFVSILRTLTQLATARSNSQRSHSQSVKLFLTLEVCDMPQLITSCSLLHPHPSSSFAKSSCTISVSQHSSRVSWHWSRLASKAVLVHTYFGDLMRIDSLSSASAPSSLKCHRIYPYSLYDLTLAWA